MPKTFLKSMTSLFRSPYGSDAEQEATAVSEYISVLEPYDRVTLNEAWQRLKIRHKKASWPLPAEIVSVCAEVLNERKPEAIVNDTLPFTEAEVFATPQGQEALRQRHGWAMLGACEGAKRILTQDEVVELMARESKAREEITFSSTKLGRRLEGLYAKLGCHEDRLQSQYLAGYAK